MAPPGLNISIDAKRFAPNLDPVLADFRLDVAPGEVVALLGPSGVGKSTLLRLAAGIDTDFVGQIAVGGIRADAAPAPGFVFQDPRLLPWMTVADNIGLADPSIAPELVQDLLARVGLSGHSGDFPHQLSGGMQRRVALARALATNAEFLLLDEPFVSLDAARVTELRRLLAGLIDSTGATVLLVTHMPDDAAALADRVVLLEGRPARCVSQLVLDVSRPLRDDKVMADYRALLSG